jgi:Leucine-rich repeat (LRR) protein
MATVMDRNTTFVVLLVHCFLSLATLTCMFAYAGGNPNVLCKSGERDALLTFKKGIVDPSNLLSSWIGQECCTWKGIACDNITGHVVHLNLRNPYDWHDYYAFDDFEQSMLGGRISDSLLELKHLHHLDLSSNNFEDNHFPSFFGYLRNLRYLNLSSAGFVGTIPHQLANLSNLHTLDINQLFWGWTLQVDNLEWLSHLSLLEFLDMSYVDLREASNWLQVMNMLPSLSELHLSYCGLDKYDPIPYVNFSSLTVLDLSRNDFVNSTFDWINSLTSLVTLDLKHTEIKVSLLGVAVQNMSSLRNLHLSGNNFSYTIPQWLCNMTALERLYLPENNIQGVHPKAIGCLSQLMLLDLSHNRLEGKIPRFLGNLCNLQHLDLSWNNLGGGLYDLLGNSSSCTTKNLEFLDLSWNQLSGTLPDQLGKHKKLSVLSLFNNMLSGPIPVSLGNLSNLEELRISSNFLEGVVSEEHFSNLTKLRNFDASSNSLTLQVSTNWVPPFQLQTLVMGSCALGPRFPSWLQSQKDLRILILSNASISDVIPSWFWSHCSQFYYIDFSQNQFRGNIPSLSCRKQIYLGSNNFSGPLPNVSSGITYLDLSNNSFHGSLSPLICEQKDKMGGNLFFLDLSKNLLYGELPNCWTNYSVLRVLNLGSNKLKGNIPSSLGSLSELQFLSLSKNNLFGELPSSLQKCEYLMIVDLSENHLSGGLSIWLGNSSSHLSIIVLRSNRFHGSIPQELCHFKSLQIMDLAHNKLSGTIPQCLGNLSAMQRQISEIITSYYWRPIFLILKGAEYELYTRTFALVTSMDLSSNNLSGEIPKQLTSLQGLRFLNLSNNQLQGKIPQKINAMKLLECFDVSMNQLTGEIPQSMASLTFLNHLNLSYNNFSGRIPSSTQLQSFSAWSFIGNHDLCGPPLTPSCVGDDSPIEPTPNTNDEGSKDGGWIDMKWFYMGMPFGFVVGFWGVFGPLAFNKAWRSAFFKFMDGMRYKLFNGV